MPLVDLSDCYLYVHKLVTGQLKPIAYGISPAMTLVYPMRPAYTVSEEGSEGLPEAVAAFWNQQPLERLASEDPSRCVILVCAGSDEAAWGAVSAYGDFPVLKFFSYEFLSPYFPALAALPKAYRRTQKNAEAKRAIVMRGQVNTEDTLLCLQKLAADYPNDHIVVSTWDDQPPALIDRARELCDRLVQSPRPTYAGTHMRNYQLTLIQRGLQAAQASGAEKCFVCRTDLMLARAATLEGFERLMAQYPVAGVAQGKLKGRLIVPNLMTRKFIPYHASDLFTYGWMEDVTALWQASPPDERRDDGVSYLPLGMETPLEMAVRNQTIVETYFWGNYARSLGLHMDYTVAEWLDFMRDFLVVVDLHGQRILWATKPFYDQAILMWRFKQTMSFEEWRALPYAVPATLPNLAEATWESYVNSQ